MLFQINNLQLSNLQKAGEVVNVDIVANHLTEDTDGEIVLKEAFSDEAINDFLNVGIIEYWHETRNPHLSKEEKNEYLLGKPIGFRWDNGKPVVTAQLTKSHPIVQKMLPHLEANQPVYAASIGGSKKVLEAKDSLGKTHRIIPFIQWDHLAIAPAPYVINRASGMNVKLLQKANDILCDFDNVDIFIKNSNIAGKEEELRKALEAPSSANDLYEKPGGVITKQSIENKPKNMTLTEQDGLDLIDTIIGIKKKKIPVNKNEFLNHFKNKNKKDFGDKAYCLIDKFFKFKKGAV